MEDAEGCRILEVKGSKKMKPDISQHEYIVVTIQRGEEKGYVVFERVPARDTEGPTSSMTSLDSRSSRNSSINTSVGSCSSVNANDKVTFLTDGKPPLHHETTWTITFQAQDRPEFYVAASIATAIFSCYPEYNLSSTNCYFFVNVFEYMLAKNCKGGVYTKGSVQAGTTRGVKLWTPKLKTGKKEPDIEAELLSQLRTFRACLETKAARAAEVQRKVEERVEERHMMARQVELQQVQEQHMEELGSEREARLKKEEEVERERKEKEREREVRLKKEEEKEREREARLKTEEELEAGRKREEELKRKLEEMERQAALNRAQ
ncbi:hypothetical protein C0992_001434 [Termitomyces sp. T32_za158]|nr:hypothetical protein C0992_001434 [Termitomyces sp. T32_za158]